MQRGFVISVEKSMEKRMLTFCLVQVRDLFPLRESLFEGQPVKIPYDYTKLLSEEYGKTALTRTEYHGHRFNATSMEWERVK